MRPRVQHLDAVVGDFEKRILQVDEVPLHVNGEDLPGARADGLAADGKARKNDAGRGSKLALANDVAAAIDCPEGERQSQNRLTIV